MDKQKLIDRVRKLYAMSQDAGSPHEAAIAARRARKMMDEFGITLADLDKSEYAEMNTTQSFSRLPTWFQSLCLGAAGANDCVVHRSGGKVTFKGFEQDVIGAQLMLDYLIEAMERQLSTYKKTSGDTSRKASGSFKQGFCIDMNERLKAIAQERSSEQAGTGLIVIKNQLVAKKFGVTRTSSKRASYGDSTAYGAGVTASQRTGLNRQATGTTQARVTG